MAVAENEKDKCGGKVNKCEFIVLRDLTVSQIYKSPVYISFGALLIRENFSKTDLIISDNNHKSSFRHTGY
jgi:hypothetical protein